MKAILVLGMLLVLAIAANLYQYSLLYEAERQNAALASELDAAHAAQLAERETFAAQLKLVREAAVNAATAHKMLSDKRDLSDADWLADVLASMWNKTEAVVKRPPEWMLEPCREPEVKPELQQAKTLRQYSEALTHREIDWQEELAICNGKFESIRFWYDGLGAADK